VKPEVIDPAEARRRLLERMLSGNGGGSVAAPAQEAIGPRDPGARVPLTAEQSQLWLHAEMAPEMPLYNESITIHRHGRYNHAALEHALSEIVRRHAVWRTSFAEINGEVVQQVAPPIDLHLPLIDISHLTPDERDAEALRLATEDARAPIPLGCAPLFRARVVKLSEQEHRLYLTLHHIIFDGVSIYRTLVPELAALVAAFERGEPSPLAEPALQYGDYAVWQAKREDREALARQVDYWRTALSEPLPRLELAGDRPRPAHPTLAGSMEIFELEESLVQALKRVAESEGATLYMVLLAAYKAMLFRYTGDTDLIVGGVTDTRRRPELQSLIGYFLNTMALRSRPSSGLPFREYLAQVRASVIGALGAADVPFDRLVRELGIRRGAGTHPLFNTLFSIEPPVDPFPEGWDLTQMDVVVGAAKYDLYLELDERPEGFAGRFLYSTELFDASTIRRMIGHWTRVLEGVAADPAMPLGKLPMLGDEERRTLLRTWNDTDRDLPCASVVERFAERAAEMPEAIAIEHDGVRWSYAELASRSDAAAAKLVADGVSPGSLVGLCLERSPWMIAAMLGVAKAGAAYLPLDPGFPAARLAMIVEDAKPALVLVEPSTRSALPADCARLVELDRHCPQRHFEADPVEGEALAYVLYTSGSTGRPKGVEIQHVALSNLLLAMAETPGFKRGETLLAITTLSFDIAELELWLPLICGGTVLLASRETAMDMAALAELIDRARPDMLQATPATWRGLIEAGWQGAPWLRALCGGEALPRALADQLLPRVDQLWNLYGPTETTIWSAASKIERDGPVSIGKPIWNTQIRVLDEVGNDLPVGAIGEIHIGGRGLARGYRGRTDLTEQRFVLKGGARLYRTGDLGRWRSDGLLECLGRTDNEEKIRGFRVAIEEIEGALAKLPGVTDAAVRAWPDASGERALTAYGVGSGEAGEWRAALGSMLPEYMIPSHFVALESLPLTPNGKVDRTRLPQPGIAIRPEAEPPATEAEQRLAAIWKTVLKVDQVFRWDDFFDLGGHSLLIARLLRRIEADYGQRIPMAALFRAPKLADMAALIEEQQPLDTPALIPIQPHGTNPPILWLDGGSTFIPLTAELGRDQPFLGISVDVVLESAGGCPARLEDAAELVIAAIREVQPNGPYRLGGWCTSGILAFAVATRLQELGEHVSLLTLIHAAHPVQAKKIGATRILLSKFRFHLSMSMSQPKGSRWRYFRDRLRGLSDAAALAGGGEAVMQPALRSALDRIALRYVPRPYPGSLLLLEPTEHAHLLDFAEAWRAEALGPFEVHVVPGGHRTLLEPPHVAHVAPILRAALRASLVPSNASAVA
jgi:amino acid adenylation domain-containing protein